MKTTKIDTKGIPKPEILAALYNGAKNASVALQAHMTPEQAERLLKSVAPRHYVDYYSGKLIKVDLSNDDYFDSYLYDREYGAGHAEEIINQLRERTVNTDNSVDNGTPAEPTDSANASVDDTTTNNEESL